MDPLRFNTISYRKRLRVLFSIIANCTRDVSAGATAATEVASKFWGRPWQNDVQSLNHVHFYFNDCKYVECRSIFSWTKLMSAFLFASFDFFFFWWSMLIEPNCWSQKAEGVTSSWEWHAYFSQGHFTTYRPIFYTFFTRL